MTETSTGTLPMFDLTAAQAGRPLTAPAALVVPGPVSPWAPGWCPVLEVVVYGLPGPQGSKSPKGRDTKGRVLMVESSKKVKPWRSAVEWAAVAARQQAGLPMLDEPLLSEMVFSFTRPAGHFGTGRNAGVLKPSAPERPAGTPDLSKLARSTEDALTTAGIYRDDARIVEYVRLAKCYTTDHGLVPGVLDSPGCTIRLWRATPGEVCR